MHAKGGYRMTVDEAQTKWCCTHEIEKCNADTCMAWRWLDTEIKNEGYCGLAGKEGAE